MSWRAFWFTRCLFSCWAYADDLSISLESIRDSVIGMSFAVYVQLKWIIYRSRGRKLEKLIVEKWRFYDFG
jgi:hypothetical protein